MELRLSDDVAVLTLDAGKGNAIGPKFLTDFNGLLDQLAESPARAAVITGTGKFFSAGLALPDLIDLDRARIEFFLAEFSRTFLRLFEIPTPVVAAINGHAIAGGCVMALQCDYRVMAADSGKIGLSEVTLGIGLPAVVVETTRLALPPASWFPVMQEGRLVSSDAAHTLGVVDAVVDSHELDERAQAKAHTLAALPAQAYAHIKSSLRADAAERARQISPQVDAGWVDTWFSDEGQKRVRDTVDRLSR